MSLRLIIADSDADKDAARDIEARVFMESFGNTPDVMGQEYGRYADRSCFVAVIDDSNGSAAGAARIIVPNHTGELKTLTDVAGEPWHLPVADALRAASLSAGTVWDAATLAVAPQHRRSAAGSEVVLALIHGLFRYSRLSGIRGAVTILDDQVLSLVQGMGVPWIPMAGATSQHYMGSTASTPCVLLISAYANSVRTRRPDLAPALVNGIFRSIAVDPIDLRPGRGGLPDLAASSPRIGQSLSTGQKSPWRPPAYRRTGALTNSSTPAGESQ